MQKKVYTVKKTSLTYVLEETTYTTMKIKLLRVIYTLWVLFPHWKLHFLTTSDNSMVIRLGFSRTFFILLHFVHLAFLLLHFVISGEEGKMLKSRWTAYKNSKVFSLLFENVLVSPVKYILFCLFLNNSNLNLTFLLQFSTHTIWSGFRNGMKKRVKNILLHPSSVPCHLKPATTINPNWLKNWKQS